MSLCPCGTGRPYVACCGRWHAGEQLLQAPDAAGKERFEAPAGAAPTR